ncbi:hypothetical protein PHLH7_19700 [Pseudomonas sp. Ost2]|nr:hypothetical protein PHLH7_19700 [Pseudomonas sp. Ost2]
MQAPAVAESAEKTRRLPGCPTIDIRRTATGEDIVDPQRAGFEGDPRQPRVVGHSGMGMSPGECQQCAGVDHHRYGNFAFDGLQQVRDGLIGIHRIAPVTV